MNPKHIVAMLFFSLLAFAEQELDLSFLKGLEAKAKQTTDINLGPEQIQLMMGFSGEGSKEFLGLGKSIELVQVRSFEFDDEGMYSLEAMEALRQKLKSSDFVSIISVKERKGFTEIAMRKGPKGMRGFVVLSAEPKQVTVVNIVGDIDMNSLSKLTGKFGIPNIQMGPVGKGSAKKEKDDEN